MTALETHNEKAVVEQLCKGNEVAFEALYKMYSERLLGYLLKLVKIESVACELLQDVFVKIWNHRSRIDSNLPFRPYLFRVAENAVFDFYRKATRDKKLQKQLIEIASSKYNHVEENLIAKEDLQILYTAIESLPPQRRQVFQLVKMEGHSYSEVSKELNISTSTISDHIVKATKFIRQQLQHEQSVAVSLFILSVLYS